MRKFSSVSLSLLFFLSFLAVLPISPAYAATPIQAQANNCSACTQQAVAYSPSVTNGNYLVAVTETFDTVDNGGCNSFTSISDTLLSSWGAAKATQCVQVASASSVTVSVFAATAGGTGGADTVTVKWGSSSKIYLQIYEVSGLGTPTIVSNTGSCNSGCATGSVTYSAASTSFSSGFQVAGLFVNDAGGGAQSAGSGYTINGADGLGAGEYSTTAVSPTTFPFTQTGVTVDVEWNVVGVAFQASTSVSQTKNCTFTSTASPTCQFASNVPVNDISVVGIETSLNTNTISSVTDSASNTYNLITSFSLLSTVGLNAIYCSNVGSAGTLTVTVNFGGASTGAIILYDIASAAASCSSTGSDDSIGYNAASASPSVSSYTPSVAGMAIGFLNSACKVACTVSAGSGYTKDNDVAMTAALEASSESQANAAVAETTPFTLSISSAWSEISVTFVQSAETTVTQPLTCTMSNSATQQTLTLAGGNPSPSTLVCNGVSSNIVVDKSSTLTEEVPADATNTRARFAGPSLTRTTTTCTSGTCTADTFTLYYQLQNTYQASPHNFATWDYSYTLSVTGTVLGTASTTLCSISANAGDASDSCTNWGDYNLQVSLPSSFADTVVGTWTAFNANTFTDTTGGNTDSTSYDLSSTPNSNPGNGGSSGGGGGVYIPPVLQNATQIITQNLNPTLGISIFIVLSVVIAAVFIGALGERNTGFRRPKTAKSNPRKPGTKKSNWRRPK